MGMLRVNRETGEPMTATDFNQTYDIAHADWARRARSMRQADLLAARVQLRLTLSQHPDEGAPNGALVAVTDEIFRRENPFQDPDIDPQDEHLYRDPPRGWEP